MSWLRSALGSMRATFDIDIHRADAILRALVDREGDDEAFLRRIVFADRRNDAHVGITVLEIEPAQQIAVGLDAVGVVDVGGLQEAEPSCFPMVLITSLRRPDENAWVPTKRDVLDAGLFAFLDLEHQVDAVVRQFDDLRIDATRRSGRCDDRSR